MSEKVTMRMLLSSIEAVKELAGKDVSLNVAIKLSRAIKEFENVNEIFNGRKMDAVKEFGEEQEDGSQIIPESNIEEFNTRMNAILDEELDFNVEKVKVEDLGNIDIKTSALLVLDWMLEV